MKKTVVRIVAIILALLLCLAAVVSAQAAGFDMDEAIAGFSSTPLNGKTLAVGETADLPAVAWTEVDYYVSDPAVVVLNGDGTLTAKAVGTSYVAIVASAGVYQLYRYSVTATAADGDGNTLSANTGLLEDLLDNTASSPSEDAVRKSASHIMTGVVIVFVIILLVLLLVMASRWKSRRLDAAMRRLAAAPDPETAEAAAHEFTHINPLVRLNLSFGSDSRGVHFTYWKQVFNTVVIPSRAIRKETKETLREGLVRLNTWGLLHVDPVSPKDYARRRARELDEEERRMRHSAEYRERLEQDEEENRAAAEAFGTGGEDNVWHNLKTLATRPDCDIYRNVRIRNRSTTSEIDAVVVAERGGIFLLEIKSVGGKRAEDGQKHVTHNMLREDPSNQIMRHQLDFTACFSALNIATRITNVLVISWPHGEERRLVDRESFDGQPYDAISVDQLLGYLSTHTQYTVTKEEREQIASRLEAFGIEHHTR